ncbi:hypothetical protein VPNG_08768 [Cytospora leucostoma]|uniref:D-xylose 1-dehydrogenase (NADP(+), D-xylono-1,5-lactone-forming) n=1 Tax=Cytospora leucostoma TaxID=1230097 RepID=A0A423VXK6_9PEZI|nr:hypothetical protein VPNG_08768 [Cytospora leucostoma]
MSPYTVKWGILATAFAKDLLNDPSTRGVSDVSHQIVAAASSSSRSRAESFLRDLGVPGSPPRAYGSYAELVADPDVQIVYVATPHSHHFQNAMLALEAGKHVLCEKALTVNASQARRLVGKAREKGLFLMEAVWTRYFPLSVEIRERILAGEIGTVYRVLADNSINASKPDGTLDFPDSSRMVNLDLAGGALLDLGIYSLTWLFQTLYHLQEDKEKPQVVASMNKYTTGADENTTLVLSFPRHKQMGIASTGLRVASDTDDKGTAGPAMRIQGSEGEIQVTAPAYRPLQYRVIRKSRPGEIEIVDRPIPEDKARGGWGQGMFWEADECARCLRDGRLESKTLPWEESIVIMEVMEEALKQGGIVYPELITSDVYDAQSPLNTGKA